MVRFTRWVLIVGVLGAGLVASSRAMAQQKAPQECDIKTVTGRIVAVDWVGSFFVVDTGGDNLSLVVSRDTTITKGASKIGFSELNQSDNVSVKYYDCGFVGLRAISITVTSGGGMY